MPVSLTWRRSLKLQWTKCINKAFICGLMMMISLSHQFNRRIMPAEFRHGVNEWVNHSRPQLVVYSSTNKATLGILIVIMEMDKFPFLGWRSKCSFMVRVFKRSLGYPECSVVSPTLYNYPLSVNFVVYLTSIKCLYTRSLHPPARSSMAHRCPTLSNRLFLLNFVNIAGGWLGKTGQGDLISWLIKDVSFHGSSVVNTLISN